jgi:hypothetical protein
MIRLSEYLDFFMQNLLRIDYENILLKTSANLWGDYRPPGLILLLIKMVYRPGAGPYSGQGFALSHIGLTNYK